MKKLILFLFVLIVTPVQSAQIVNVEYIHNAIKQKWDITVPYNAELSNPRVAANMKYLLTAIDVANEMLNGEATTNYGTGEYATMVAADTVATDIAVDTLIQKNADTGYKFTATIDLSLYEDNQMDFGFPVTEFGFKLGATGTFYIDWGDGTTETIKKDNTDLVIYTHDYGSTSGTYTVKIGGMATDYSDDKYTPTISFGVDVGASSAYSQAITEISGSLGAIFPTLSDGSQPSFRDLFYMSAISAIPSGLFDGIHGTPVSYMFEYAFGACYNLTSIPENLFAGITGAAEGMFNYTFSWCNNLTSIPENLFSGVTDLAEGMFRSSFEYCQNLTGPSARINGQYLYEIWPDATYEQVGGMYIEAMGLSDYDNIPDVWK